MEHPTKMNKDFLENLKKMEHPTKMNKDFWENLKPFEKEEDIPDIPRYEGDEEKKFYQEVVVKNLIRCGAIPKDKLEVGATYYGDTRNTDSAKWNGKEFEYERYKFGSTFTDTVNHFQDDDGYALFVPLKKI